MRLGLVVLMTIMSVIYGDSYFPMDSQILSTLKPNLNNGLIILKNSKLESPFDLMKIKKPNINCFDINPDCQNNKIALLLRGNAHELIARRRRTTRSWIIEEPLYVEEPQWILINEAGHSQMGQRQFATNKEDPFYIARGKRLPMEYSRDYKQREKLHIQRVNELGNFRNSNINFQNSLLNNSHLPMYFHPHHSHVEFTGHNYGIDTRDKRSDIMDMLAEPFVISRGKKHLNKRNDHDQLLDTLEYFEDSSSRNRRGKLFDQLMKDKDPFYVARGKRISPIAHSPL